MDALERSKRWNDVMKEEKPLKVYKHDNHDTEDLQTQRVIVDPWYPHIYAEQLYGPGRDRFMDLHRLLIAAPSCPQSHYCPCHTPWKTSAVYVPGLPWTPGSAPPRTRGSRSCCPENSSRHESGATLAPADLRRLQSLTPFLSKARNILSAYSAASPVGSTPKKRLNSCRKSCPLGHSITNFLYMSCSAATSISLLFSVCCVCPIAAFLLPAHLPAPDVQITYGWSLD